MTGMETSAPEPRQRVSPLARRLAKEAGVSLAGLAGSGPHGRVIADDIRRAASVALAQPETSAASANTSAAPARKTGAVTDPLSAKALADALKRGYTLKPITPVRRVIAERLTLSKQRIPHYSLNANCRADELIRLRAQINQHADGAYKLSVNDFIVRAAALALAQTPEANCAYDENEGMVFWNSVDISVAVATEDGLFTPVVRDADRLALPELAAEISALARAAREGSLKPQQYLGGSFSVSNLGMFGVSDFNAVINPPQCGILAVGAAEPHLYPADGGGAETGQRLRVTLSLDHRAIDGALGAKLLAKLRHLLEHPLLIAIQPPPEKQD